MNLPVQKNGAQMLRTLRLVADQVCESPAPTPILDTPEDIVKNMADVWDAFPEKEQVWVVFLNLKNRVIGRQLLSVGTDRQCLLTPRDVLRSVLLAGASSFIVMHNHPSGDPAPSSADRRATSEIRSAAEVIGVTFLDHLIVGNAAHDPCGLGYFTFKGAGVL